MRWPTKEQEQSIVMIYIPRTSCCESLWRYLSVLGVHMFINSLNIMVVNKQVWIFDFLIADDDRTKVCAHLADGKNSHAGPDTHLGHELVRDNTAKDDANATNDYCHSKQPPPKVIIRKVVLVIQITVVCEAETPCKTLSH
jgi:hypothetical protein